MRFSFVPIPTRQDLISAVLAAVFATASAGGPCLTSARADPMAAAPWAVAPNQVASWPPDILADYFFSGQTPHPAVVRIVAAEQAAASLGSGVLVDRNHEQGLVLTNWHVVRDTRSAVLVQFPDGLQAAGNVVRWDEAWDLAAVVIWKPTAAPIPLAATPPAPGDLLTIAGYGRGPYRAQTGRCTEYLSPAEGYPREFVELSVGARQGDSGGPILNERGELAGVLFGQTSGRTIGACSTRLRAFLASVGSDGFSAADQAAMASQPHAAAPAALLAPAAPGSASPRMHMAAATFPSPSQAAVPGPQMAMPVAIMPAPGTGQAMAPPQNGSWSASLPAIVSHLPTADQLARIFDIRTNGQAILSAAGGLALGIFGLKTLFGRRRRTTAAPRDLE